MKGNSNSKKTELTIDVDMGTPPVIKAQNDDMGTPPIKKAQNDAMGMPPIKAPINAHCAAKSLPKSNANCAAKSSSMLNANYSTKSLAFKLTKNNDISYNDVKNVCQPIEQTSYQSYEPSVSITSHVTKNTSALLELNTYSDNSACDQFDGNTGNCKFYDKANTGTILSCLPYSAVSVNFGSFHQNDQRFKEESRDNQCTCNAISFIISCYFKNSSLTLLNLDNILITGDQIYTKVLHDLKQNGQFHCVLLNFEELPEFVQTQDGSFKVEKHEIISGIAVDFHGMSQVQTLHKALTDAFRISSALLIIIGAICSAVQYRDSKF